MDWVDEYKKGCAELARKIERHLKKTGEGPTYFCVKAGAHQAAIGTLVKGTARPQTTTKLREHLQKETERLADLQGTDQ